MQLKDLEIGRIVKLEIDNKLKDFIVIHQGKIPYSPGASTCLIYDGNKGLSCKCFILSGTEINLDVENYNKMLPKEGILLPYFKDENVNRDYGCNDQWTRSRVCGSDDHRFTWHTGNGKDGLYIDFNINYSIRPCLVLPNNLNFLSETSTIYFSKYILFNRK